MYYAGLQPPNVPFCLSKTVYTRANSKRKPPVKYRIVFLDIPPHGTLERGFVLLMQSDGVICNAKRKYLRVAG